MINNRTDNRKANVNFMYYIEAVQSSFLLSSGNNENFFHIPLGYYIVGPPVLFLKLSKDMYPVIQKQWIP